MSRVIAYVAGDAHVPEEAGGGAWKGVPEVAGDALHALGRVVELCVVAGVPLVLPGDVIDGPSPEPGALVGLYDALRPMVDNRLSILHALGNHERARDWLAPFGPSVVRLDGTVATVGNHGPTITGLSYTDPYFFPAAAKAVPATDVGVYHQTWGELVAGQKVRAEHLPAHRLAVGGDVHVRSQFAPAAGPRWFLSPGPLVPQAVTEFARPASACYAVNDDLSCARVDLPARGYYLYEIDSPAAADDALNAVADLCPDVSLPEAFARPYVVARMTAAVDGFEAAAADLAGRRGVTLRVYSPAATSRVRPASTEAAGYDPARNLIEAVMGWPTPATARDLAVALVTIGADPDRVLAAARAAYEADHPAE